MNYHDLIYFDQAATSYPKPTCVHEAIAEALERYGGNPGRSGHRLSVDAAERVFTVREQLCRFFDAPAPERVVFTKNATEALNLAICSVLQEGDHALCSDMEHNAVLRPLFHLKSIGRIDYSVFHAMPFSEEALFSMLRKNTRALILNHASNVCGRVHDAKKIGAFCKKHGILFILDASQSAGHIPISMREMNIDILCAPAHKGLYGIMGAGFVIFKTQERFPAFLHGGSGVHSFSPEMPEELPERYEAGSLSVPAILALGASLAEIEKKGVAEIGAYIQKLERFLKERLLENKTIHLYEKDAHGSGILSFTHAKYSPSELAERLDRENVAVRSGYHCAPLAHRTIGSDKCGTVRIGLGVSNTLEECERFLEILENQTNS